MSPSDVHGDCVLSHSEEGLLRNVFRGAGTSTFTAQVGSRWLEEAMSNGKCNKPWLLSPWMEGKREGGRVEQRRQKIGQTERKRERGVAVGATLLQLQEENAKWQQDIKNKNKYKNHLPEMWHFCDK